MQTFLPSFTAVHPERAEMVSDADQDTKQSAFSLIEVVLAMGVAAFALVTILALLPAGLKTFRGSMNQAVGSQIAERVFNDLSESSFSDLTNATNFRYFDEQGTELLGANASNAFDCVYWVEVSYTNANTNDTNSTTITGNISTNLYTATVLIANNPRGAQTATQVFQSTNPNTMTFTELIGHN